MTVSKTRAVIGQLLDLYESGDEQLPVLTDHARVAPLAHGWYVAVRRLGLAVIHLVENGFEFEAAPLRRSLIEHVVALRWLVDATDNAVTSLLHAHQHSMRRLQEAVEAAGWSVAGDEAFDVILGVDHGTSSEDRNMRFKQRCEEYGTDDLYSAWLSETSVSHPSFSTANAYLRAEPDGEPELVDHARGRPHDALAIVAWALLVASESFNQLIVGKPWTAEITRIGDELVDLVKDGGLR